MIKEQLLEAICAHYDELNNLNKIDKISTNTKSDFIKLWSEDQEVLPLPKTTESLRVNNLE